MLPRLTKTFVQNTFYERPPGSAPTEWRALAPGATYELPLDQQITEWVQRTGAIIIHPGQLGIHTQWHGDAFTLKCITLGITVLYVMQEASDVQYEQAGEAPVPFDDEADPGANPVGPGDPGIQWQSGGAVPTGGGSASEPGAGKRDYAHGPPAGRYPT